MRLFRISRGFKGFWFGRTALFAVQRSRAVSFPHGGCRVLLADELEGAGVNQSSATILQSYYLDNESLESASAMYRLE